MSADETTHDSQSAPRSVKSDDEYATTGELPAVLVSPGDVLAGKYEVEEIIGRGGMGIVVAARHLQLEERVALKLLLPSATQTEEFSKRFMREAQVTAKLRSEHIARVTDVGILANGSPYMIMEYLQGQDLRQVLRAGTLSVSTAIEYIVQACEGMAEAHSYGIVHRDLKPSNLYLTQRRDGSDLIKVLDFGISKALLREDIESRDLTSAGTLLGSPRYMSPEQLQDTALVDSRADVWSLATILYEMLSGRPPFAERTHAATCVRVLGNDPPLSLTSRRPEVPEMLQVAIFRALERDPDRRTPDVAAFASSLLRATKDLVAPSVEVSVARIQGMVDATGSGRVNPLSGSHSLPSLSRGPGAREPSVGSSRTPGAWVDSDESKRKGGMWPKVAIGAVAILLLFGAYQLWLRPADPPVATGQLTSAPTVAETAATPPKSTAFAVTVDAAEPRDAEHDAGTDVKEEAAATAPTRYVPRYVPPPPRPPPKETATAQPKKPGDILESRQ